jgi:hypothetical protein
MVKLFKNIDLSEEALSLVLGKVLLVNDLDRSERLRLLVEALSHFAIGAYDIGFCLKHCGLTSANARGDLIEILDVTSILFDKCRAGALNAVFDMGGKGGI